MVSAEIHDNYNMARINDDCQRERVAHRDARNRCPSASGNLVDHAASDLHGSDRGLCGDPLLDFWQ